jgi:hypothetical protein
MAQIIKHRRGSLESLSTVTGSLQKGEIVIASGSTNLTASNGNAIAFIVPQDGTVQATNRIIRGTTAPNTFPASTYNGMLNGVPYYASSSTQLPTLFLLGSGANEAIDLVGNIQPFSASVATSINALSASIGSGTIGNSVNALNTFSGAVLTQLSTIGTVTASYDGRFTSLATVTGSLISSASAASVSNTNLNTFSASANTKFTEIGVVSGSLISSASAAAIANANQNTFTSSANTKFTEIGVVSGSLISSASSAAIANSNLNTYTSSLRAAFTASGTNIVFTNDVTIPGNLTVRGTQTIVDSTTVQIGDNILELNGSGAANGGLWVKDATSPNTNTGSIVWDSTNDYWKAGVKGSELKVLLAGGDSVVSGSSQITLQSTTGFSAFDSALATITGSLISSASAAAVANSNQNTFTASANISIAALNSYTSSNTSTTALNAFTASTDTKFSALATYTGSVDGKFTTLATYTGSVDSKFTTIASVTASLQIETTNLELFSASANTRFTEIGVVSGSLIASASAAKTTNDSQGVSITNLNTFSASVNTSVSALNTSSASQQVSIDNLNTFSGSQLTKDSALATYTGSVNTKLTEIGVVSGSLIASASSQNSRITVLEGTGTKQGVGTTNDVTFNSVTTTANVTIGGDLVVQGNTVTLNTATLVVEDKLITLASGSTNAAAANGAGIEVAGATATITYQSTPDAWQFNKPITGSAVTASLNVPSGGGNSKRIAFRDTNDNINFVTAPTTAGDLLQYDGTNFVMSNTIDGGSF